RDRACSPPGAGGLLRRPPSLPILLASGSRRATIAAAPVTPPRLHTRAFTMRSPSRRPRPSAPARFRPRVESLEDRATPAAVNGQNAAGVRPFEVAAAAGAVTLAHLTITGGNVTTAGGGLLNAGTATTLTDVTVTRNTAVGGGGIANTGTLTVSNSVLSRNAG